ncbi:MAG TPA: hypothetical protein VD993_06505 [Chitinophagaceae bacterium]|nr:hypothetical protein [Chitinophagaceae bacterium]
MKRFIIALLVVSATAFWSFRTINNKYNDILTALGIPPSMAKDNVFRSFLGGYFSQPSNPAYKTYPAGKRAAAVQQLGMFVKSYLMSAEFQKKYEENYEMSKPRAPKTVEERINEIITGYKDDLKKSEERLKKAPDNLKSIYEESIVQYKKRIAIYEDKNHPEHAKYMKILQNGYEGELRYYQSRIDELDKKYPKDIKVFIKMRLEEFLRISADVDFDAELVQQGKLKKFVNPEYERKHPNWKYCFRAGRETIEAARKFADQWLKEM